MYHYGVTKEGKIIREPEQIRDLKESKSLDDHIYIQFSQIKYQRLYHMKTYDGVEKFFFSNQRNVEILEKIFPSDMVKVELVRENIEVKE